MNANKRQSERLMVLMPDEEPVVIQAGSKQYFGRLVNLSAGGGLISIPEANLYGEIGNTFALSFSNEGSMFDVRGELIRVIGWYAAFRFANLSEQESNQLSVKLERMRTLSDMLCPDIT
jgi:hypothetical protein